MDLYCRTWGRGRLQLSASMLSGANAPCSTVARTPYKNNFVRTFLKLSYSITWEVVTADWYSESGNIVKELRYTFFYTRITVQALGNISLSAEPKLLWAFSWCPKKDPKKHKERQVLRHLCSFADSKIAWICSCMGLCSSLPKNTPSLESCSLQPMIAVVLAYMEMYSP